MASAAADAIVREGSFRAVISKAKGQGDATYVISSPSLDRDRDRILPEALEAVAKKGGQIIALWQHKSDQPIGFWNNLRMQGAKLLADLQLAGTNLALMVRDMLGEDVPLAASIGFMGRGTLNDQGGIDYDAIELLETSIVSVPSNRDAQRIKAKYGIDATAPGASASIQTKGDKSVSPNATRDRASVALANARRAMARANLRA